MKVIKNPGVGSILTITIQPDELKTIGSAAVQLLPREGSKFVAVQIWMNLTVGTVMYDFPAGAFFTIAGNGGNSVVLSSAYELQVIQTDELNVAYLNNSDGFKIDRFTKADQDLTLTTVTGDDATVGDGVLTVWIFGYELPYQNT